VNLTDASFKQMFLSILKGLLRKGYAPRWPTHGYEPTREAAMAAFVKSGVGSSADDKPSLAVKAITTP
jgi:hypothetical protein